MLSITKQGHSRPSHQGSDETRFKESCKQGFDIIHENIGNKVKSSKHRREICPVDDLRRPIPDLPLDIHQTPCIARDIHPVLTILFAGSSMLKPSQDTFTLNIRLIGMNQTHMKKAKFAWNSFIMFWPYIMSIHCQILMSRPPDKTKNERDVFVLRSTYSGSHCTHARNQEEKQLKHQWTGQK
jgi:hypothetical protein